MLIPALERGRDGGRQRQTEREGRKGKEAGEGGREGKREIKFSRGIGKRRGKTLYNFQKNRKKTTRANLEVTGRSSTAVKC